MPVSHVPAYNLKAVLKETGIAADTLRAWERRYGLPQPERTPGGHRLYSQYDIQLIKWLIARQAEGFSISRAVDQWNVTLASGRDPLADAGVAVPAPFATQLDAMREEWLSACLAYDETKSEQILNQAFALYSAEIVLRDLILPDLHAIGEQWQAGLASVQQEHFLSALTIRRIDALIAATPPPVHPETVLLACPPGELHSLPHLYLNLMLRRLGWNVVFLGADVPLAQLDETVQVIKPALVVLSAQQLVTAAALKHAAALLLEKGIRVAFGGRVFNRIAALSERTAGEFLGEDFETSLSRIEQLLREPVQAKAYPKTVQSLEYRAYTNYRAQIEVAMQQQFAAGMPAGSLAAVNGYLGAALAAALDFGDIAYLEADMDWIQTVLAGRDVPAMSLSHYLTAYARAMRSVMASSAGEAPEWLEQYAFKL